MVTKTLHCCNYIQQINELIEDQERMGDWKRTNSQKRAEARFNQYFFQIEALLFLSTQS